MDRKKYYDAEPWYFREKTRDWYQQMELSNDAIKGALIALVTPESVVTEVACGGGWLAELLTSLKPRAYLGFDFATTAAENAARRLEHAANFRCVLGDALASETYPADTNLILAHQFFHCLVGVDRARWLSICQGVLSRNVGSLCLSSMIGLPDSVRATVNEVTRINKPGNRYYAEDAEIQAELRSAGFRIDEILYPEAHVAIYRARA
jgi:ubiquinone/menaquinone biosynthesis C-methylase UbiE